MQQLQQQKIEANAKAKSEVVTENDLRNAFPRSQAVTPCLKINGSDTLVTHQQPNVEGVVTLRPKPTKGASRPVSMEVNPGATGEKGDSIGPLEAVAKGVKSQKLSKMASPKSHSRSSSHDSYFEKGAANSRVAPSSSNDNAVKFGEEGIEDEDEELDIR